MTLTEPSGWRIVICHLIGMAAGIVANVLLRVMLGDPPFPVALIVGVVVTIGVGLWMMEVLYQKPYRRYRAEKAEIEEAARAEEEARRHALRYGDHERLREIEAEKVFFGQAAKIRKK